MHNSARETLDLFVNLYIKEINYDATVVEIGSLDVNGSIKDHLPKNIKYTGLDIIDGPNVDVVLSDPYEYPLESSSVDFIISSSCFEHTEFFWKAILESFRILKPQGVIYINAPSNGYYHQHPMDYFRYYPDSGLSFQNWGIENGYNCHLLESFIGSSNEDIWNDFVCVLIKDKKYSHLFSKRILQTNIKFFNGRIDSSSEILNKSDFSEDMLKINYLKNRYVNYDLIYKKINLFKLKVEKKIYRLKQIIKKILKL